MHSKPVLLILHFLFLFISAKGAKEIDSSKSLGIVDSLLNSLENDKWDHGESACLEAAISLLNGVKNQTLWATWIWNAMQLPVGTFYGSKYHLGNFDQCLQVPWSSSHPHLRMQYCLVDVKLIGLRKYDGDLTDPYGDAERYIGMKSLRGSHFNTLSLGVCLPISCKPGSIAKISRHVYRLSHLPFDHVEVDPRNCQVAGQKLERATEFYVFWWILLIMTSVCVLVYFLGNTQHKSDSTGSKLLRCFCLTRNIDSLTEIQKEEINMMHGMRALTSFTLIVMHVYFMINGIIINHLDVEKDLTSKYGRLLLHLDILTDTFLIMSGLLHIKGLISSRPSTPLKGLCKRYLRLIFPTYALTVMCFAYVLPHLGSGPVWPRFVRKYSNPCAKSWWKNLLMMGNKVGEREYCADVTWYVHCDYQLAVFGTAIFMLYRWNKRGGFMIFTLAYILSLAIPTFMNYWHELPGLLWYNFGDAIDMVHNKVYGTVYVQSYNRASSYLTGLAMGYLMTVYRPQDHRNAISKASSILGFIIGCSLLVLVLQIGANSFNREYSALVTAVYAALDRSIWAVGICIIIAVCEYGTLPIINDFLSSKVFVPLSKLSYINYLCHTVFIYRNLYSLRAPMSYDISYVITKGFGYVVMSCSFSFLFWLFIEAPAMNLINLLFDNKQAIVFYFNLKTRFSRTTKMLHMDYDIVSDNKHGVKTEKKS